MTTKGKITNINVENLVRKLRSDSATSSPYYVLKIIEIAYGLDEDAAYKLYKKVNEVLKAEIETSERTCNPKCSAFENYGCITGYDPETCSGIITLKAR